MAIDFDSSRWDKVIRDYEAWWRGELRRPLVSVAVKDCRDPGRPMPDAPLLAKNNVHDLSVPVEALVDRMDWELSKMAFLGDSFPYVLLDVFGPGVVNAFLGARLDNSTGLVWFHPPREVPITELHFEYDPDNIWLRRVKDLCAAAMKRWQGQVALTLPDLGGNLDILSAFRPGEQLLTDLYDHPEDVKRVTWEAHELWHRYYREIDDILMPTNRGRVPWCGIFSMKRSYILQCDFCYMIGPDMFREFVLPELDATTRRLDRSVYHLDGIGQLPHLDMLLDLPHLNGVQWIPGANASKRDPSRWPEVIERILAAGKKAQVLSNLPGMYEVLQRTGLGQGVHNRVSGYSGREKAAEAQVWIDRLASADYPRIGGSAANDRIVNHPN